MRVCQNVWDLRSKLVAMQHEERIVQSKPNWILSTLFFDKSNIWGILRITCGFLKKSGVAPLSVNQPFKEIQRDIFTSYFFLL